MSGAQERNARMRPQVLGLHPGVIFRLFTES